MECVVAEFEDAWADSLEEWRSRILRVSGNPVEALEIGSGEVGVRLLSGESVWATSVATGRSSMDDP
jgi:hypothetical protein